MYNRVEPEFFTDEVSLRESRAARSWAEVVLNN